jgi:cell division protein FtsW
MRRFSAGVLPPLAAAAIAAAIIAHQDLGTAVLVFAAASITLIAAGARLTHFTLLVAPAAAIAATAATLAEPYRVKRVLTFLNPYQDPAGDGYHMIQSLVAVASGNGTGKGLGFGLQKFGYLPEDRTDFLFAIIAEELGLAGVATVLLLYATLLLACLTVIRREPHPTLRIAATGITATLALQTLINLLVVTGMAPTKGIALPLLSSGGTGWVLTAASLGLIASIDRSRTNTHNALHTPSRKTPDHLAEPKPTTKAPNTTQPTHPHAPAHA